MNSKLLYPNTNKDYPPFVLISLNFASTKTLFMDTRQRRFVRIKVKIVQN